MGAHPYPAFSAGIQRPHIIPMPKERRRTILMIKDGSESIDCPLAPPARANVYARTLHIACLFLGGIDQLARHLQVARGPLQAWITGEEQPPLPIFLAAIEVVLLHLGHAGQPS